MRNRASAGAAIAGVVTFVIAWAVLGALRDGYSPVEDAISRLAELGAPNRGLMTMGIVAFGAGALAFAPTLGGRPGVTLALAGIGSLGVAAFPCTQGCPGPGELTDTAHVAAAGLHYVGFALTPALTRTRAGYVVSAVAAPALGLHALGYGPNGLLQRVGLTLLDLWLVWVALQLWVEPRGEASSNAEALSID